MAESSLPSGVVTFLLTDVEDSTRIWEDDRVGARAAFERHDVLIAEQFAAHGGHRPKDQGEGDSAFAVFADADRAVACAVELQRAFKAERWPGTSALRVRMALHTGEAEVSGGNYKGSAVHRCARLRGLAHGGQTVLSSSSAQAVRELLPEQVTLRDLGVHALRGLVASEHVFQVCHPDLSDVFPPLRSQSGPPRDLPVGLDVPMPQALVSTTAELFVGRDSELETLRGLLDEPGARFISITGEPGIGKSRLAAVVAHDARERGATVLFGSSDEEAVRPYQPIAEALSGYIRALPPGEATFRLGRLAADLGSLVPDVADAEFGSTDAAWIHARSDTDRFRLFEAVAALIAAIGGAAPVTLVLDDLHWADKATVLLLRHIALHPDAHRLLIVATCRTERSPAAQPLDELFADLERAHLLTEIALGGISDDEVARMLARGQAAGAIDPRTRALALTLRAGTEGNPFFIGEVIRDLSERGAIHDDNGTWVPDATIGPLAVPHRVHVVVEQRLARLSTRANDVLTIAAVAGAEFSLDVLLEASGTSEDDLIAVLDEAVSAGLLEEAPEAIGLWVFAHALVRQTLYDGLTKTRRARLHRVVGDAIETLSQLGGEMPLATLAFHYAAAGGLADRSKAVDYARRAGDRATALLAYEEASRLYAMALDAVGALGAGHVDHGQQFELLCADGAAAWRTSDVARARARFTEAADLARDAGDHVGLAHAALGIGGGGFRPWWPLSGVVDAEVVPLLEQALQRLDRADGPLRVELLGSLAEQLYFAGEPDRQRRLADDALAMARRLGDPGTLARALLYWRLARWESTNPRERLSASDEAMQLAESLDRRELVMQARSLRLVDRLELGDVGEADADAAALEADAIDLRVPYYRWATTLYAAMRAMTRGEFAEAQSLAAEAIEFGEQAHTGTAAGLFGAQLGAIAREQGRADDFRAMTTAALDRWPDRTVWQAARSLAAVEAGDIDEARAALDRLAEAGFDDIPNDFFRLITLAMVAEACGQLDDGGHADRIYEALLPHADQLVLLTFGVVCFGSVAYHLGVLATVRKAWSDAALHFERALALDARLGADALRARTQLGLARMLLARDDDGDEAVAHGLLARVVDDAARLGMQRLDDEARSLSTDARMR